MAVITRLPLLVLLLGTTILAFGCSNESSGGGDCGGGPPCAGGFFCVDDQCRRLCADTSDCGVGEVCDNTGICAPTATAAPVVDSIDSDGPDDGVAPYGAHRIGTHLIIAGENLDQCQVDLLPRAANLSTFEDLEVVAAAPDRLQVRLPSAIDDEPGDVLAYSLSVSNASGSRQVELTLLRGADGVDIAGTEIINRIETARAGGATLAADTIGSFNEPALQDMQSRLGASEALTGDLDDRLVTVESAVGDFAARAAQLETDVASLRGEARWICPGVVRGGVCLVGYRNAADAAWLTAVNACSDLTADLCTSSQYAVIQEGGGWGIDNAELFYSNRAVWSADFSDNDGGVKSTFIHSSDDPTATSEWGYACCVNLTPEPFRARATLYEPAGSSSGQGVWVTYVHAVEDTTFPAAANVCASVGADLCTKSQYVTLHDNSLFGAGPMRVWTNEGSDNDGTLFNAVVGPVTDSPGWGSLYAYACCAPQRPIDGSCPVALARGVCPVDVHTDEDTNFFDAARACAGQGADLCSKSQMTVLRNVGEYPATGASWTNDGADNDSTRVGGLDTDQPDNPTPDSDLFGYACCL